MKTDDLVLGLSRSTAAVEAIEALVEIGAPAVPALCGALRHRHSLVRRQAAEVLGRIADRGATEALSGACEDVAYTVRLRAAWALGKIGDPAGVPALCGLLRQPSPLVRQEAAVALARIAEASPHPILVTAIEPLQELNAGWDFWDRRPLRFALKTVQRATAEFRRLPRPATPGGVEELPIPSRNGSDERSSLPLAADA